MSTRQQRRAAKALALIAAGSLVAAAYGSDDGDAAPGDSVIASTDASDETRPTTAGPEPSTAADAATPTDPSTSGGAEPSGEPVRIGLALANSGPAASVYQQVKSEGIDFWVDSVGGPEGLLGRPVELIERNTDGTPESAVAAVRQLIEQDQVDVVVCCFFSAETAAILPIIAEEEVLNLNLSALAESRDPASAPYTFSTQYLSAEQSAMAVAATCELGGESLGALVPAGAYGEDVAAGVQAAIDGDSPCGVSFAESQFYEPGSPDFGTQIDALSRAGVDSVFVAGFGDADFITAYIGFEQAGFLPNILTAVGGASPSISSATSPAVLEHVIATGAPSSVLRPVSPEREAWSASIIEFVGGEENFDATNFNAVQGYSAMQILQAGVEAVGSLDAVLVSEWLEANPVETIWTTTHFSAESHSAASIEDGGAYVPGTFQGAFPDAYEF